MLTVLGFVFGCIWFSVRSSCVVVGCASSISFPRYSWTQIRSSSIAGVQSKISAIFMVLLFPGVRSCGSLWRELGWDAWNSVVCSRRSCPLTLPWYPQWSFVLFTTGFRLNCCARWWQSLCTPQFWFVLCIVSFREQAARAYPSWTYSLSMGPNRDCFSFRSRCGHLDSALIFSCM